MTPVTVLLSNSKEETSIEEGSIKFILNEALVINNYDSIALTD